MIAIAILPFILALIPLAHSHDSLKVCAGLLTADAATAQRKIWAQEVAGDLTQAGALRSQLAAALGTVPIRDLIGFNITRYSSKPELATFDGGAKGLMKRLGNNEEQNPKSEIAAIIVNEELGWPIRIPVTVWRTEPARGSLQLWVIPLGSRGASLDNDYDLALFDFLLDNHDRINANVLQDQEFGTIAIDHAAAFTDIIVIPDWSNFTNIRHNCVHPAFAERIRCVEKLLEKWRREARLDWAARIAALQVPRLIKRLEPWVEQEMLKRFIIRLCVIKELFSGRDYQSCRPYLVDAGFNK